MNELQVWALVKLLFTVTKFEAFGREDVAAVASAQEELEKWSVNEAAEADPNLFREVHRALDSANLWRVRADGGFAAEILSCFRMSELKPGGAAGQD